MELKKASHQAQAKALPIKEERISPAKDQEVTVLIPRPLPSNTNCYAGLVMNSYKKQQTAKSDGKMHVAFDKRKVNVSIATILGHFARSASLKSKKGKQAGSRSDLNWVKQLTDEELQSCSNAFHSNNEAIEEMDRGIFVLKETDPGYYDIPLYSRFKQKLAREAALKSKRVVHADVRQATPVWTNTSRVNKANQFTPRPVQLSNIRPNLSTASKNIKTGRVNVNTGHGKLVLLVMLVARRVSDYFSSYLVIFAESLKVPYLLLKSPVYHEPSVAIVVSANVVDRSIGTDNPRLLFRTLWFLDNHVTHLTFESMAAPVITISSDALEESVTSIVSRVILFGTIPTKIPIVPDMPTDLLTTPKLPAISPFLCSDDSESEPTDESPERHMSLRLHDDVISSWRDRVRSRPSSPSGSSSPDTTILPSRKRISSSTTSIPSAVHTAGALSPTRADLLPPRKRYRGTSAMHSDESSDEGSLVTRTDSDMDLDIRANVEVVIATAATTIVDGLGIEPVLAGVEEGVEAGFEPWLAVVETESELEEAEADEEADAESQSEGTIEIGVEVATWIDIPDDLLMPDAIERLGKLEEGMQARVVALKGSNTRLRDALGVERVRADSLQ
ncbi:hypothetical protein Tco_0377558 [Tanacetum coccineum]